MKVDPSLLNDAIYAHIVIEKNEIENILVQNFGRAMYTMLVYPRQGCTINRNKLFKVDVANILV